MYQDLSLPLSVFIKCIVDGDLTALIIRGQPIQIDIAQSWANIYSQYLDLNDDTQVSYILQLQKDIALLTSHVIEVEGCIFYLSLNMRHEGLVKILKDNGYSYSGDLDPIKNKLALKRQTLESKTKEYEDYMEAHAQDDVTESYFIKTLFRLAKYQGVAIIRAKDISVKEFVLLLKDYVEYINQNNKALDEPKG